eukprot:g23691.t1
MVVPMEELTAVRIRLRSVVELCCESETQSLDMELCNPQALLPDDLFVHPEVPIVPPEVLSVLSVPDKKLEKLEKLELEEPKPSFHVFEFVSLSHV